MSDPQGNDRDAEDTSQEDPTIEEQGVMTPDQDSVEDANVQGVNPDK